MPSRASTSRPAPRCASAPRSATAGPATDALAPRGPARGARAREEPRSTSRCARRSIASSTSPPDVERWPELLPHYRYVAVADPRRPSATSRWARGAARSPFAGEAIQRPMRERRDDRVRPHRRRHARDGGRVALRGAGRRTLDVSIEHELDLGWPLIGDFAAERVVGPAVHRRHRRAHAAPRQGAGGGGGR